MNERTAQTALDGVVGALNRDIGDVVKAVVELGLSAKHSKEKCKDLALTVESFHGSVIEIEKDRQRNGLSSAFTERTYEGALNGFLVTVKDCQKCLEKYAQKKKFVRVVQSLKYDEEFESLTTRLNNAAKVFGFTLQVHQTSLASSTHELQQKSGQKLEDISEDMKQVKDKMQLLLELFSNRVDIPEDESRVSKKYALQVGQSLFGNDNPDYLEGRMLDGDRVIEVMLVRSSSKDIPKETAILKLLSDNDPYETSILRFYGTHAIDKDEYLVMERPGKELIILKDWIMKGDHSNDWREKRQIIREIVEGVAFAHGVRVVHKNLSSYNIYLTDDGRPKILNFFRGRVKANPSDKKATEHTQRRWTAPENLPAGSKRPDFNEKSDIFSLGVIMWELITDDEPFRELATQRQLYEGRTKDKVRLHFQGFESAVPFMREFQQISLDCMKDNPEERPAIDDVVSRLIRLAPEEMYVMPGTNSHEASTSNA